MSTEEPVGMTCPSCREPAMMAFAEQAFCGNDSCRILTWNPGKTINELLDDYGTVDIPQGLA